MNGDHFVGIVRNAHGSLLHEHGNVGEIMDRHTARDVGDRCGTTRAVDEVVVLAVDTEPIPFRISSSGRRRRERVRPCTYPLKRCFHPRPQRQRVGRHPVVHTLAAPMGCCRVFSGTRSVGSYLTAVPPKDKAWAQEAVALPLHDSADMIQEVLGPAGTRLLRSRTAPIKDWGHLRGDAGQHELRTHIPTSNFGPGAPLP